MRLLLPGRKPGILAKVLVGTSALVAASVLSLSGLFLLRHQAAFERQFELRAQSLARSLAGQSQFSLLMANRAELERIARTAMASDADVLYVVVEDASANFMAGVQKPPLGRRPLPPAGNRGIAVRRVRIGTGLPECVEASALIVPLPEGEIFSLPHTQDALGKIRVGLSLQSQHALFVSTLWYVSAIAFLILVAACAVDFVQFRKLLQPLIELAHAARSVGQGGAQKVRAVKRTDDEIGILVDTFNEMLDQVEQRTRELHEQVNAKERALTELAEAQQRLIELSRQAGMAEIATSVLHNVGNVLNSVNVSASIAASKVKQSRVGNLGVLLEMLHEHSGTLDDFLRCDPKGQRVLPYLAKLAAHFQQEREALLSELAQLMNHVDHIKRIVATQQNHAKVSGLVEEISLADLTEDALRILQSGFDRHQVTVLRDFEVIPQVVVDKHQVLQILLNLLRNARQAITAAEKPERIIQVRIRRHGEDQIRIQVQDNGIGLAAENLTRIFSHGFTTKRDGHGFGLHHGANTAHQMGGALWAESDGPGMGAVFTLELPLRARNTAQGTPPT
jgi:signal transduction histidine kinase